MSITIVVDDNHPGRYEHIEKTPNLEFKCRTCEFQRSKFSDVLRHVEAVHLRLRPFSCTHPSCDKSFPSQYKLRNHMISHANTYSHSCEVCHETFKYARNLTEHIQAKHLPNEEKQLHCDVSGCSFSCWRNCDLNKHKKSKSHTDVRHYECFQCFQRFIRGSDLKRHVKSETACEKYRKQRSHKKRTLSLAERHPAPSTSTSRVPTLDDFVTHANPYKKRRFVHHTQYASGSANSNDVNEH